MGRTLSDLMADHIDTVFLNTEHFAVSIDYRRGINDLATGVPAIVGASEFEVASEFGLTRFETRDYLIKPSALAVLPEKGDLITEGTRRYTVTAPGGGTEWRYDDEHRLLLRIHTVLSRVS